MNKGGLHGDDARVSGHRTLLRGRGPRAGVRLPGPDLWFGRAVALCDRSSTAYQIYHDIRHRYF
jgi:hypothetical protein